MKYPVTVLILVVALAITGCAVPISTDIDETFCPKWTEFEQPCDMRLYKNTIGLDDVIIKMDDWQMLRLTIAGGDVVLNNIENITAENEDREKIEPEKIRLYPGTYFFRNMSQSGEASTFSIVKVNDDTIVVSGEFVRHVEATPTPE